MIPDSDDLLVIDDQEIAEFFRNAVSKDSADLKPLELSGHSTVNIKGIFAKSTKRDDRILLQKFMSSQYLQKKGNLPFVYFNKQFDILKEQGFTLDTKLTAVIENGQIKFISFHSLRNILKVQHHFLEATNDEVEEFQNHPAFHVEDAAEFHKLMDERTRKLIYAIRKSKVLENNSARKIHEEAQKLDLKDIYYSNGKFTLPKNKKQLKTFLSFLEDSVYRGTFSNQTYETNSKREVR